MHYPHHGGGIGLANPGGFGGFGGFQSVIADVAAGLVFIIAFVVVVGLLVLIVRFLLAMTRAAEVYVRVNAHPVEPAATIVTPATGATAPAPETFPWGESSESATTKPTPRGSKPKN